MRKLVIVAVVLGLLVSVLGAFAQASVRHRRVVHRRVVTVTRVRHRHHRRVVLWKHHRMVRVRRHGRRHL
jgi:hypothetical protein